MDKDMQQGHGHATQTWTRSMDMDVSAKISPKFQQNKFVFRPFGETNSILLFRFAISF
jgi:hypothetical protein